MEFSEERIKLELHTDWLGQEMRFFEACGSTNDCVLEAARDGAPQGLCVLTDWQTAGKGRHGRGWENAKGEAVAMSFLLRFDADSALSDEAIPQITLLSAMAVADAIRDVTGISGAAAQPQDADKAPRIKWPNDIVIGGRKVCGILIEHFIEPAGHFAIVGIGINAANRSFPEELREIAGSILALTGQMVDRNRLVALVLEYFEQYYAQFLQRGNMAHLVDKYNDLLINCGKLVKVLEPKGTFTAVAKGINESGALLVEREDGTVSAVDSGEVSVRGVYGYI